MEIDVCMVWMGEDMIARVEYSVSSYGARRYLHPNDPDREDPEWQIEAIYLRLDTPAIKEPDGFGGFTYRYPPTPEFEATGALFRVLAWNEEVNDTISAIVEEESLERYYARRRRAGR